MKQDKKETMTERTIYISLPISGRDPEEARQEADSVKHALSRQGYRPVSPFDIWHGKHPQYADYICNDLRALADCEAIFLCQGWNGSRGCRIEHKFAEEFGKRIIYQQAEE